MREEERRVFRIAVPVTGREQKECAGAWVAYLCIIALTCNKTVGAAFIASELIETTDHSLAPHALTSASHVNSSL